MSTGSCEGDTESFLDSDHQRRRHGMKRHLHSNTRREEKWSQNCLNSNCSRRRPRPHNRNNSSSAAGTKNTNCNSRHQQLHSHHEQNRTCPQYTRPYVAQQSHYGYHNNPEWNGNIPFPHIHHTEHAHHTYSGGFTYGYASYPEAGGRRWPGLGETLTRTTVVVSDIARRHENKYVCRTSMLNEFFPNTRAMAFGREFRVTDEFERGAWANGAGAASRGGGNQELQVYVNGIATIAHQQSAVQQLLKPHHLAALNALFRAMQDADGTNHFDIFARLRYKLEHEREHVAVVDRAVLIVGGMGEVLSWDEGLGCNDIVLDQIEMFVLSILPPVRQLLHPQSVSALVYAIGFIWRPDEKHKTVLKMIWDNLDNFERVEVKDTLKQQISMGRGMTFGRMFAELERYN